MTALQRLARLAEEVGAADPTRDPARDATRMVEAILFASAEPLGEDEIARRLPASADLEAALSELRAHYATRGVHLVQVAGKWAFRTAGDLAYLMSREVTQPQRLSRAAMEVLAIVAYHQPTTRAEIEEIRGVTASKGTLDTLLETGWVRLRGRRRAPGRPVTYGTTAAFLAHFGLDALTDLPGLEELKGLGFLEGRMPPGFDVPMPNDDVALTEDEEPFEAELPFGGLPDDA